MAGRPSDWHVLGLDGDPTPGDPFRVRELARKLGTLAADAAFAAGEVRRLSGDGGVSSWVGEAGAVFAGEIGELPGQLDKLDSSYDIAGRALKSYGEELETAQSQADAALARGREAHARLVAAREQLGPALTADTSARSGLEALTAVPPAWAASPPPPADPAEVARATRAHSAASSHLTYVQGQVTAAEEDVAAERRLALAAKGVREDAARTCTREIGRASDAGIQNDSWWKKAGDFLADAWNVIVEIAKVAVLVLGIVAMIVGGPLAWVVLAAALVVLADTLMKYASGRASLWDVGFALVDCIPGAKGITTTARLAKGLRGGAAALRRGGTALAGRGRNMMSVARWGLSNPRANGVEALGRLVRLDPVDVATGEVVLTQTDVQLPGLLPLVLSRTHLSSYRLGGWFGRSWASTLDQRIEVDDDGGVYFATADGMVLIYPAVAGAEGGDTFAGGGDASADDVSTADAATDGAAAGGDASVSVGADGAGSAGRASGPVLPMEGPRWPLTRGTDGTYTVSDPQRGWSWHFAPPAPSGVLQPWGDPVQWPLAAVSDRNGHRIDIVYDADGAPAEVTHSGGYRVRVHTEDHRVVGLSLLGADHRRAGPGDSGTGHSGIDGGAGGRTGDIASSGVGAGDIETGGGDDTGSNSAGGGGGTSVELVRFSYTDAGDLAEVVNSSGQPLRFDYDAEGRMLSWADRNGTDYRYTYDAAGRCVATAGSGGALTGQLRYDMGDAGHIGDAGGTGRRATTVVDSLGHATVYRFNELGQNEAVTNQLGHTTTFEWDRHDRKLAETDPLGRTTRYGYDAAGNLAEVVRPDGSRVSVDWNALHLPVTIVEPDGARWERAYDDRGNLTAVADPAGATTSYECDARGHLAGVVDALGNRRQFRTDAVGLPVAVVDPLGATTSYTRDAFGRVVAVADPRGGTTRLTWTVEGSLVSRTRPDGATERWAYDAEGALVEHIDAAGLVTRTDVTHFDLPAARTGPDGARLEFAYDTELRLVAVTNPQGLVWRYDYDPAGNMVRETDFNGRLVAYAHDAAGQLAERTNGAGQTVRFTRDPLGNVVEKSGPDGVTTFAYDAAGRVVRATNADADVSFARDALGRVVAETCNGRTVTSTYDPLGRRLRRATPSGADSRWDYAATNLPAALHTAGRTLRFAHDAAGREIERRLDTGVVLAQAWDTNHQLLSQTVTTGGPGTARQARLLQRRDYSYSPDGYVIEVDDLLAGLRRFDLDPMRRITAVRGVDAHGAAWQEHYAYDASGNITDASWPVPAHAPGRAAPGNVSRPVPRPRDDLDAASQGSRAYAGTLIRRAGAVRYGHDSQGRVTLRQQKRLSGKPRTWRFTWDADDRMTGVTTPDGTRWRYRYDPFGRRIAKQRLREGGSAEGGSAEGGEVAEQVDFAWDGAVLAEQSRIAEGASRESDTSRSWSSAASGGPGPRVAERQVTTWEWEPHSFRPLTQSDRRLFIRPVSRHDDETRSIDGTAGHDGHDIGNRADHGSGGEGWDKIDQEWADQERADQEWFDVRFHAIVTDLVGTPAELVDPDGGLGWHARTTLWGASPPPPEDDVDCPLRFPGQYHDPETALNYNYHRHYDPATGRYSSNDPLGLAPAPNPHAYVLNPLSWLDPLGLSAYVFRGTKDVGGVPELGESARTLGARSGTDIPVDDAGMVHPNTGGMSVSPGSPANLPSHRRPPDFGGSGRDPVWSMDVDNLPNGLSYRPDPANPSGHGFVEPATPMSFDNYQDLLHSTQGSWNRVEPPGSSR